MVAGDRSGRAEWPRAERRGQRATVMGDESRNANGTARVVARFYLIKLLFRWRPSCSLSCTLCLSEKTPQTGPNLGTHSNSPGRTSCSQLGQAPRPGGQVRFYPKPWFFVTAVVTFIRPADKRYISPRPVTHSARAWSAQQRCILPSDCAGTFGQHRWFGFLQPADYASRGRSCERARAANWCSFDLVHGMSLPAAGTPPERRELAGGAAFGRSLASVNRSSRTSP